MGWNGAVNIETGKAYTANGSEMKTPYSGDRAYKSADSATTVNGGAASLEAIVLTDDNGGAYTYYKLRDLDTWAWLLASMWAGLRRRAYSWRRISPIRYKSNSEALSTGIGCRLCLIPAAPRNSGRKQGRPPGMGGLPCLRF